jgi:hypothetical protein
MCRAMSSGTFSGGTVINAGLASARSAIEFHPQRALDLWLLAPTHQEKVTLSS